MHLIPDEDLNNIIIGNSRFSDDTWDLSPFITTKSIKDFKKYIHFEYISDADMKKTVKQYTYYKLRKSKPQSVRCYINSWLPVFIEYYTINGIHSFVDVTLEDYLNFNLWMRDEKKLATSTGLGSCHVVEEIIRVGQIKGWNVPQIYISEKETANQLWNKKDYSRIEKTQPIPDDIFDKIMHHAIHEEKNILVKAGIIIQSQTGLRINEVLSIQEGCVKRTSDGYDYMEIILDETPEGELVVRRVFINNIVKDVIAELADYTAVLRKKSGLKELFISKHGEIRPLSPDRWTERKLFTFVKNHNIRDDKGKLYPLRSRQFRATFLKHKTDSSIRLLDEVVVVKKDEMQPEIQPDNDITVTLREQIKNLKNDNEKLISQLAGYEELKFENKQLKKLIFKLVNYEELESENIELKRKLEEI